MPYATYEVDAGPENFVVRGAGGFSVGKAGAAVDWREAEGGAGSYEGSTQVLFYFVQRGLAAGARSIA